MGWSSGSGMADDIWFEIKGYIPKDHHQYVARKLIKIFELNDCDTMHEAELLVKSAEYAKGHRLSP